MRKEPNIYKNASLCENFHTLFGDHLTKLVAYYVSDKHCFEIEYIFKDKYWRVNNGDGLGAWGNVEKIIVNNITFKRFDYIKDVNLLFSYDNHSLTYNRISQYIKNYLRNEKLKELEL